MKRIIWKNRIIFSPTHPNGLMMNIILIKFIENCGESPSLPQADSPLSQGGRKISILN
jgi:hypothetical protein